MARNNAPAAVMNRTQARTRLAQLVFPAGENKLNMGMLFKFRKYEVDFAGGGKGRFAKNITDAHIALPLPENIQDTLNVNYENSDLGMALQGMKSGEAIGQAFSEAGFSGAGQEFMSRLPTDATYLLRTAASATGIGAVLNLMEGNVPNPYTTAVFKNVEIRRHNFNFRLTPETPQDSIAIQNIINQFKYHSLPAGGGTFLQMPSELDVEFFGTNALYGFARCVIQGVTVNYNPSNAPAFFKNTGAGLVGAPQAVELQLQLSEIEQLYGTSFQEYNGGNGDLAPKAPSEQSLSGDRPGNPLASRASVTGNVINPVKRIGG